MTRRAAILPLLLLFASGGCATIRVTDRKEVEDAYVVLGWTVVLGFIGLRRFRADTARA